LILVPAIVQLNVEVSFLAALVNWNRWNRVGAERLFEREVQFIRAGVYLGNLLLSVSTPYRIQYNFKPVCHGSFEIREINDIRRTAGSAINLCTPLKGALKFRIKPDSLYRYTHPLITGNFGMSYTSAIPDVYYAIFAFYEPFLTILGLIGTFCDPKSVSCNSNQFNLSFNSSLPPQAHDQQAPWPFDEPPDSLPRATLVTIMQLAHVCALLGIVNIFVLTAARQHLSTQPALQEKIVASLLTPLMIGDVLHLYVTLWALGDERWQVAKWGAVLWSTVVLGFSLMIPRLAWHLGIGRFVYKRDGHPEKVVDKH
jgi:hypothetical protein